VGRLRIAPFAAERRIRHPRPGFCQRCANGVT